MGKGFSEVGTRETPARAFKGLTSTQRHALEYLAKRRDANPNYHCGFRLRYQYASMGAAARRVLEPAGFVTIDRVTPHQFLAIRI